VRVTLAPSAFFDRYTTEFPQLAAAMHAALGRTVALIDGLETVTALRCALQAAPFVTMEAHTQSYVSTQFSENAIRRSFTFPTNKKTTLV
jgi:hypothetical protein